MVMFLMLLLVGSDSLHQGRGSNSGEMTNGLGNEVVVIRDSLNVIRILLLIESEGRPAWRVTRSTADMSLPATFGPMYANTPL